HREHVPQPARPRKPHRLRQPDGRAAGPGQGGGRALTTDMIDWASRSGFAAIQFNAVVDTNTAAIRLYESLGFVTLGVAPGRSAIPCWGRSVFASCGWTCGPR